MQRPRVAGAALHRRVVGDDHALDALDHADAGDHAGADGEVACPSRPAGYSSRNGESGSTQQLDALARQSACRGRGGARRTSRRRRPPPWRARRRGRRASRSHRLGGFGVGRSSAGRASTCSVGHDVIPQQSWRPGRSASRSRRRRCRGSACRGTAARPRTRHVAHAAVQLHGLVGHPLAGLDRGVLGEARLGDQVGLAGELPLDDVRGCRPARRRSRRASRPACAAPTWRAISGLPNVSRSRHHSTVRSRQRCALRRPARPGRSARPRTARRSGRSRCSPRRPGWPTGTRTSTKDSSAVSEQCQPILSSFRSTVKPGRALLDDEQRDPARARAAGAHRGRRRSRRARRR